MEEHQPLPSTLPGRGFERGMRASSYLFVTRVRPSRQRGAIWRIVDGTMSRTHRTRVAALAALLALAGSSAPHPLRAQAPAGQSAARAERTVWYFYRVKWGFQDEFVTLFQRNHYPILKDQVKAGRMKEVRTFVPTYHGDGRADWTFAVVITYRDIAAMTGPSNDDEIIKRLYPDRAKFDKEEQRRFEILDAHWDVPLNELDLEGRR
jgi:hypothetical protein